MPYRGSLYKREWGPGEVAEVMGSDVAWRSWRVQQEEIENKNTGKRRGKKQREQQRYLKGGMHAGNKWVYAHILFHIQPAEVLRYVTGAASSRIQCLGAFISYCCVGVD